MIPSYFIDESDEGFTLFDGLEVKEEPKPEIPPPIWDSRPIDPERCVAATKALCG
jgi:hypothetical protein